MLVIAVSEEGATREQLASGHVVLTSRLSQWSGGIETFQMGVLAAGAAVDFLLERTKGRRRSRDSDPVTARTLAGELGFLALALEQAGAYVAQRRQSLVQYLADWQQQRDRVPGWFDPLLMELPGERRHHLADLFRSAG